MGQPEQGQQLLMPARKVWRVLGRDEQFSQL
jgi:hypothetical protein